LVQITHWEHRIKSTRQASVHGDRRHVRGGLMAIMDEVHIGYAGFQGIQTVFG
jgi:hypothetical protein